MAEPVLAAVGLGVRFDVSPPWPVRLLARTGRQVVQAVDDVSLALEPGRTFALVGESGCGKSTLARTLVGLQAPSSGVIRFHGQDVAGLRGRAARPLRRQVQMIFQDPYASLDPRWTVGRIIAEPIRTHRLLPAAALPVRIAELLDLVGLAAADARRYPHQFSGGQRQRISIARALASNPPVLICDEPTSALDVSVQAQVLNLMRSLQRRLGLSYLLITHNLAVVAHMADTVGIMYLGRIVEQGPAAALIARPRHPYTRLLLSLAPDPTRPGQRRAVPGGEVPSPFAPPGGCAFHPRCPLAAPRCARERPDLLPDGAAWVACHAVAEGRLPPSPQELPA